MGLLLSVLVGCVGVLELLACLKHASAGMVITINPPTPCLSYHDQIIETQSVHDSLCNFSHSSDVKLSRDAKHKLENLHEYSLRVRSELRSLDKNFESTLSQWSSRDLSSRPDSRLSSDFNLLVEDTEQWSQNDLEQEEYDEFNEAPVVSREDYLRSDLSLLPPEADRYVRIPTPIPFGVDDELSRSASSSDLGTSFDNDSGNEVPTTKFFDDLPVIKAPEEGFTENGSAEGLIRPIPKRPEPQLGRSEVDGISQGNEKGVFTEPRSILKQRSNVHETFGICEIDKPSVPSATTNSNFEASTESNVVGHSQRRTKSSKSSTTILRKPTCLKSKNAEISKSAENLSEKKSKRHREPERRRSDIVRSMRGNVKDESTNTSPQNSPVLSRSESKRSVSVEVQTSFEEKLSDDEVFTELENTIVGLSESKRDLTSRERSGRKSFKSKRFRSTSRENSSDESRNGGAKNATTSVERSRESRSLRISKFEEALADDYEMIKDVIAQEPDSSHRRSRNGWRKESSRSKSSIEEDEEYVDADDGIGPIQYSIPDPKENEAFWLIFSGEYTKAMNKDWHSGHFCCWQCDESLTGQRYVLRDEHPYCIKCYESVFANGCEECNKIIGIDSKDLSYKDKHWHEACFLCNKCRVSLVDKQFGSKVDKIYCGNCYDTQFASRCDGCGEIFRAGTKKMEYKTRQWHEKCFCCVVCKNPIGTKSFIPREQEIYCAGCYEDKFATRCVKCNKIITSGGVTYKNEPWHRDCFTCSNCNNSLAGQRFTSRDDKPYCADCFGELFAKRCTACSKPITGIGGTRFISFEDRHWHNDCFICAGCKTSLVGRGFITDADDIICPECAKQKLM